MSRLESMRIQKKILQIVSGDLWGGAEAQVLIQSRALRSLGWEIHILLFNKAETYERYNEAGFLCHFLPEQRGVPVAGPRLVRTVRSIAPDIVAAHGYKECFAAFSASLCLGIPWISTFHGLGENYQGFVELKSKIYIGIYIVLSRIHAARIITVSKALAADLRLLGLGKLEVVHNAAVPARLDGPDGEASRPRIAVAGRLVPVKRLDIAVSAMQKLLALWPPGTLPPEMVIIGDGPERQKIESQVCQLQLEGSVTFLGFRSDAAEQIGGADLLLLTSDSEGIPTVLLEAAACGTPVAATRVGGIPEVAELLHGCPIEMIPRRDPQAAAEAMLRLLEKKPSPSQRAESRRIFERYFLPEKAAARLNEIYLSTISREG